MAKCDRKPATPADEPAHNRETARALMNPIYAHSALTEALLKPIGGGKLDGAEMVRVMAEQGQALAKGDLSGPEAMLLAQSTTLNSLFVELVRRSHANMGEHMTAMETYMRLALKAQGQCRATLETLAAMKNPPTVFARQANFAAGPQQVNNGVPARAVKSEIPPNELLEAGHEGERLDLGTPGSTTSGNRALEAVGARHGASHA